jgi:hypothetical protein
VNENVDRFISAFAESLSGETFIKLSLGNYKGSDKQLQKILIRLVAGKRGKRLFVQYKYETRDVVKNYPLEDGSRILREQIENGFKSGHLFTLEEDLHLDVGKRNARLNIGKPTIKKLPSLEHDREKAAMVDHAAYYLRLLGITGETGQVLSRQFDKWKQINKFVEILANLYRRSGLSQLESLKIVDMGSGKGYLTFAAYDYFANTLGLKVEMRGVDTRGEQVKLCNEVASSGGYDGLRFEEGQIAEIDASGAHIVIALHACDTATDDAIFKGIDEKAEIILTAPCCHRELRTQLKPPPGLNGILRHPVMLSRTAQLITDGLRSLMLEKEGYSTRMLEFVDTEHTPMNIMITAVRGAGVGYADAAAEIDAVFELYGIEHQHLRHLLLDQSEKSLGMPGK